MDHTTTTTQAVESKPSAINGPALKNAMLRSVAEKKETPQDAPKEEAPKEAPKENPIEEQAGEPQEGTKLQDPFSPKFAALTKKEKELRQIEQDLKARGEKLKHIEEAMAKAEEDPDGYLKAGNLSYEKLVNHYLKGAKDETTSKVESLEEKLKKFEEEQRTAKEEAQKREQQQKVEAYQQQIATALEQSGDKYELTRVLMTPQDVYNEMVSHYLSTQEQKGQGEVLSIDQASEIIEKRLQEHVAEIAKKSGKLKNLLNQVWGETTEEDSSSKQSQAHEAVTRSASKTLSNSQFQDRPIEGHKKLSRDESIRLLAEKLRTGAV